MTRSIRIALLMVAVLAAGGVAAAAPGLLGLTTAILTNPAHLAALETDPRVHFEPGARAYAEAIAKILPRAVAKIEAAQGRRFGRPFIVVAYADDAAYAAANGRGSDKPSGVAFLDRVTLSPRMWREEPRQLEAYLTHELSHAHLFSHLAALDIPRIPAWYTEGLAVWASDGGGAQRVSVAEATRAIRLGQTIAPADTSGFFGDFSLKFAEGFVDDDIYRRAHMAYRQAGLFVGWLRRRDPLAFADLLDRILTGEPFKQAFESSFRTSVADEWNGFIANIAAARAEGAAQ